jgi:hypothetical protein
MGEELANMLKSLAMARRPDRAKAEILSETDLKELRRNLAHLSIDAALLRYSAPGLPNGLQPTPHSETDADPRPGLEAVVEVAVKCRIGCKIAPKECPTYLLNDKENSRRS